MSKANITLAINGNNQLTNQIYSESFDVNKKLEYEFSDLTSLDGYIFLPVSKIIPFQKIIANSTGQLEIKVLTQTSEDNTSISGVYYNSLDPYYSESISGIAISTSSTVGINGNIVLLNLV